jgi:hypothetical protein
MKGNEMVSYANTAKLHTSNFRVKRIQMPFQHPFSDPTTPYTIKNPVHMLKCTGMYSRYWDQVQIS